MENKNIYFEASANKDYDVFDKAVGMTDSEFDKLIKVGKIITMFVGYNASETGYAHGEVVKENADGTWTVKVLSKNYGLNEYEIVEKYDDHFKGWV